MLLGLPHQWLKPSKPVKRILPEETGNGLGVSTVFAGDIDEYETAILDKNGAHPVERYRTKKEAVKGHNKWVKETETLTEIIKLGLPYLYPHSVVVILERKNYDGS